MIVADASAIIEVLLRRAGSDAIVRRLLGDQEPLAAPSLLDVEVASVLRRYWLAGRLTTQRGEESLELLRALPLSRYSHEDLLPRIWEWRANLTAYDAAYVALAEALDAPLVTCDEKLANSIRGSMQVELFAVG
jgi:predicted nucleic acid-binding protein